MSALSTLNITRTKARLIALEYLVGNLSDSKLEEIVDDVLEPKLYNARIVDDSAQNDDERI